MKTFQDAINGEGAGHVYEQRGRQDIMRKGFRAMSNPFLHCLHSTVFKFNLDVPNARGPMELHL